MKTIITMLTAVFLFGCTSTKKSQAVIATEEINYSLTETYWKLTELRGQPVTTPEGQKEMYLIIKKDGNLVNGFGGCNSFSGTYTAQEGIFRIKFSQMIATLMACANMEKEKEFMDVLQQTDNYAIKGKALSLNKAKMAPLARFEAVLMK